MTLKDLLILEADYFEAKNEYVEQYRKVYNDFKEKFENGDYSTNERLGRITRTSLDRLFGSICCMDECSSISEEGEYDFRYYVRKSSNEIEILKRLL